MPISDVGNEVVGCSREISRSHGALFSIDMATMRRTPGELPLHFFMDDDDVGAATDAITGALVC